MKANDDEAARRYCFQMSIYSRKKRLAWFAIATFSIASFKAAGAFLDVRHRESIEQLNSI
jgi:hypothetical protein